MTNFFALCCLLLRAGRTTNEIQLHCIWVAAQVSETDTTSKTRTLSVYSHMTKNILFHKMFVRKCCFNDSYLSFYVPGHNKKQSFFSMIVFYYNKSLN